MRGLTQLRGLTGSGGSNPAVSNHGSKHPLAVVVVGILSLVTACSDGDTGRAPKGRRGSRRPPLPTWALAQPSPGSSARQTTRAAGRPREPSTTPDGPKATYVVRISVAGKDSHVVASATKNVTVDAASETQLVVADFGKATGKGLDCSAHVTRAVG